MTATPSNPQGNRLRPGISLDQIESAIRGSGYPLQTVVAAQLRESFSVEEEWAYTDRNTGQTRTLDLWAELRRQAGINEGYHRVRPRLNLLIECKQSELPYVFFLRRQQTVPDFPLIAGLRSDTIQLKTDDDRSTYSYSILTVLNLIFDPFLKDVAACSTFSRIVRKGKIIELSGSDVYNGIVMPLMSATMHFDSLSRPRDTAAYYDAHLVVPLAVLDSPMIGVEGYGDSQKLSFIPWVRILRSEPSQEMTGGGHRGELFAIDVVHKDYFQDYLSNWLQPFAEQFRQLALKHSEELATGLGFVSGLGRGNPWPLEQNLTPATAPLPPMPVVIDEPIAVALLRIRWDLIRRRLQQRRIRRQQRLRRRRVK